MLALVVGQLLLSGTVFAGDGFASLFPGHRQNKSLQNFFLITRGKCNGQEDCQKRSSHGVLISSNKQTETLK